METTLFIGLQCVSIFFARVSDVSLGTIRNIMLARGEKSVAAFIGFFEVMIWALVISQIITNLGNVLLLVSFALGFATGNYVGGLIEEKIARGYAIAHVVPKENHRLAEKLREAGFGVTINPGLGSHDIYHVVLRRKEVPALTKIIEKEDRGSLYAVTDVRREKGGFMRKVDKKK